MRVAVASGKGGTGKTLIATHLAVALARRGYDTCYVDCDVEAPNGHLFLKPVGVKEKRFKVLLPQIEEDRCTGCGDCQQACAFNAMLVIGEGEVMVFPELCHSCGACAQVCPTRAISEVDSAIGDVLWGHADPVEKLFYLAGRLDVGQPRSSPLVSTLAANPPPSEVVVIDSPPGTSCSAVASLTGVDHVLLVTEPTPFGLHDLRLALAMCDAMKLPVSAIINRSDLGDDEVERFLDAESVPILAHIPFRESIARACANGELAFDAGDELTAGLSAIFERLGLDDRTRESDELKP